MTEEQKAAYIMSQVVAAYAEIEGMKAGNAYRQRRGETITYNEDAFFTVAEKYGINHNAVLTTFTV